MKYKQSVPALVERRRPARPGSFESDLLVPLAQSAVTGLLVGSVSGGLAWAAGAPRPGLIGAVAGGVVLAAVWMLALVDRRALLWEIETVAGLDLNDDGIVGKPEEPVRVEIQERQGRTLRFVDLPAKPDQIARLAAGVLGGRSFSEASWTGRGRPFSRRQFARLRDEMIRRGLAMWVRPRAHAQGVELTAAGRAVFRRLADRPTPLEPRAGR